MCRLNKLLDASDAIPVVIPPNPVLLSYFDVKIGDFVTFHKNRIGIVFDAFGEDQIWVRFKGGGQFSIHISQIEILNGRKVNV